MPIHVLLSQAQKVAAHLQKASAANDTVPTFVWGKKVVKELESGKKMKELSIFRKQGREAERLEEIQKVCGKLRLHHNHACMHTAIPSCGDNVHGQWGKLGPVEFVYLGQA